MADDSDEALMLRVGNGDAAACRTLVDRHLAPLTAFAGRMLGNRWEAEDVAQEVFLRVWADTRRWRPGAAKLRTWLFRVAYNLSVDRLRRRREAPLDAVAERADPSPDVVERLVKRETAQRVAAAVAALPERQRAAIVLCHNEGLGNIEAADVLGVSVEAVESLLARGRRTLRRTLMEAQPNRVGVR